MKKALLSIFLIILGVQFNFAQILNIDWQKCYGGTNDDAGFCIQPTSDKGYVLAGWSKSNNGDVSTNYGQEDCWIVKIDSLGNIQWQKTMGGSSGDNGFSVQQTTDGGYIVASWTTSNNGDVSGNHGQTDYWVVKLNSSGNILWKKTFGGTAPDAPWCIRQTFEGGYIVGGRTESNNGDVINSIGNGDIWILKLDTIGNIKWQKTLGGSGSDALRSIRQTTDKGYIIAGYTVSNDINVSGNHGITDYWVAKLDSTGNIQWQKCLGGTNTDYADLAEQTTDGGYIVTGFTNSNDGDITGNHGMSDFWVVKLDSIGSMQWQKTFGGTNDDRSTGIVQTTDRGYIAIGYTNSSDGDVSVNYGLSDFWIIKIDSLGNLKSQKSFGGSLYDYPEQLLATVDGGCIVLAQSSSSNGDVTGNHGWYDLWVVKLNGSIVTDVMQSEPVNDKIKIYPNPTESGIQFSVKSDVKLFNLIGENILEMKDVNTLDLTHVSSGIYYIILTDKNGEVIQKNKIVKN